MSVTGDDFIRALALPSGARVDLRVAKKLLAEQGVDTAGLVEARWVAALKAATVGVAAASEAIEIQVLALRLGSGCKPERVAGQVHRAIPYPALLVIEAAGEEGKTAMVLISLGDEAGGIQTCGLEGDALTLAWMPSMALAAQPRTDLAAVYRGWRAAVERLRAARITGALAGRAEPEARRQALEEHARLEREMARLRQQAAKEKQMGRRIDFNLKLKGLESEFAAVVARLGGEAD